VGQGQPEPIRVQLAHPIPSGNVPQAAGTIPLFFQIHRKPHPKPHPIQIPEKPVSHVGVTAFA
jgi:hypothetical protein